MAANTSGGVTGKTISPLSIAVACAVTGMVGRRI
ncbi:L-lactate permease [Escherichia coli]